MTLSDISIRKPVFAWMLMIGLLVFGTISYLLMGISQLPDVDFPVVTVSVSRAGASPDVMESAVADIIEDAVMSVDGIQLVQSTSQLDEFFYPPLLSRYLLREVFGRSFYLRKIKVGF